MSLDTPRIPDVEFGLRLANLKDKMAQQGIDLLVLFANLLDPGHVRYLADVSPINESAAMVVPLAGDPILCTGQACQAWSEHKSRVKDIRILPEVGEVAGTEYEIGRQYTFTDLFQELRGNYTVKKIGVVGTLIFPHVIHRQLTDVFPAAEIVNAEPLLFELRAIKSANEIACMRKAAGIIDNAFTAVVEKVRPGWTELDIQAEITATALRGGAESMAVAWDPMIPAGVEHTRLCMNRNSLRRIGEGEIIDLQAGCVYEGYNAALCTPLVLGEIPAEIRQAVLVSDDIANNMLAAIKPGAGTKAVNAIGRGILDRHGYGGTSPYGMIHTTGLLECESPWLPVDEDFELREGMTVCLDIFLFRLPWGSFRYEDTIAIQRDGAERLTQFNARFVRSYFAGISV
ncbi:MAG: M24 family metallopeptidase [Armatimonadota bacterium]